MAGALTVNLALQRSKVDNPAYVRKLNVCGVQVDDITVVQQFNNLEVGSFSANKISELEAFQNCHRLAELYLRKNNISDLRQLFHLSRLPALTVLSMSENPIAESPDYRPFIIAALPRLRKLDEVEISSDERAIAESMFRDAAFGVPPSKSTPAASVHLSPRMSRSAAGSASHHRTEAAAAPPPTSHDSNNSDVDAPPAAPRRNSYGNDDVPIGGGAPRSRAAPAGRVARSPPQVHHQPVINRELHHQPPATARDHHSDHHFAPRGGVEASHHQHHTTHHHHAPIGAQVHRTAPPLRESPPSAVHGVREEAVLKAIYSLLPELSPVALHALKMQVQALEGRH